MNIFKVMIDDIKSIGEKKTNTVWINMHREVKQVVVEEVSDHLVTVHYSYYSTGRLSWFRRTFYRAALQQETMTKDKFKDLLAPGETVDFML